MNVLYISYDGMTDPLGQSQVLPYLAGLSAAGYKISLISCEKPEQAGVTDTIRQICAAHNIQWYPIPYTRRPPILSTVKDVRAIRNKAAELQRATPFDIVHCRSYISALIGLGMKKKWGTKFIFDMRGFWADERVDGGLWNLSNPLYKTVYNYFKRQERKFLMNADSIISLTHKGEEEMQRWNLNRKLPVTVIPCCVDTVLFDPTEITKETTAGLRHKLGISYEAHVVGYVGSVGTWYLLREMLDFFRTYLIYRPAAILLFVTTEQASMIAEVAAQAGLDMATLRIIKAARTEVSQYISVMDIGLFFIKPAYSKIASSPVKQGEMMAMGLPVICNAGVGDSDYIINKYKSGILVTAFSEQEYKRVAEALSTITFDKPHIREGAFDYFDLRTGIHDYQQVYQSLAG